MSGPVLLDTGTLVSYLDSRQEHHRWAVARFSELPVPFLLPEAIVSESCFLLQNHPNAIDKIGGYFERGFLSIIPTGAAAQSEIFALIRKYRNVPMSYADACLLWLAEQQPRSRVFTTDSDFKIYRLSRGRRVPLIAPF